MHRIGLLIVLFLSVEAWGQNQQLPAESGTVLSSGSTLVLVPATVMTKSGEPVYTLTAKDFTLTDDGVEQVATIEQDAGSQPLALVIVIETGGVGAAQLQKYRNLGTLTEAMVGGVEHRIAVVSFDSAPELAQNFTPDFDKVHDALRTLEAGDKGAAILDSLVFALDLLRKQPTRYRRAILLVSETNDHGSQTKLENALRQISDTNTMVYSVGFSTSKAVAGKEASHIFEDRTPGPPHGCMGKDPNIAPGDEENKWLQAYDCLSLLAPPLRAGKILALSQMYKLQSNIPETVAQLTGGEFYKFKDQRSFDHDLITIAHQLPNRYLLSFQPKSPHPGIHALGLHLKDYPGLVVTARNSYWAEDVSAPAQ